MRRKATLYTGEIYHVFNRSIAEFRILNDATEFSRMLQVIKYYQINNEIKLSDFLELEMVLKNGFDGFLKIISPDKVKRVQIIAYCLMPTHFHLVLKQLTDNGISTYLRNLQNSYSHYFNTKHRRRGPLWESKYKNVLVTNDEQLNHLVRYLHLNPSAAGLVKKPEDWHFSSYKEYLSKIDNSICQFSDLLDIKPSSYRRFVNDQISYQRELSKIKKLLLE